MGRGCIHMSVKPSASACCYGWLSHTSTAVAMPHRDVVKRPGAMCGRVVRLHMIPWCICLLLCCPGLCSFQ